MRIPGMWLRWKPGVSERDDAISLERVDGSRENGADHQMQKCRRETNASTTKRNEIAPPTRLEAPFQNRWSQPENGRRLSDQQFQNARPS